MPLSAYDRVVVLIRKPLSWLGNSLEELKRFPDDVCRDIGYALYRAQIGLKHRAAKPLRGLGAGVMEIAIRDASGAYRTVYTAAFKKRIYVLHVFQKKAKRGIATPQVDLKLIRQRLRLAAKREAEEK